MLVNQGLARALKGRNASPRSWTKYDECGYWQIFLPLIIQVLYAGSRDLKKNRISMA